MCGTAYYLQGTSPLTLAVPKFPVQVRKNEFIHTLRQIFPIERVETCRSVQFITLPKPFVWAKDSIYVRCVLDRYAVYADTRPEEIGISSEHITESEQSILVKMLCSADEDTRNLGLRLLLTFRVSDPEFVEMAYIDYCRGCRESYLKEDTYVFVNS